MAARSAHRRAKAKVAARNAVAHYDGDDFDNLSEDGGASERLSSVVSRLPSVVSKESIPDKKSVDGGGDDEPESEDAVIWPWAYGLIKYTIFVIIFTYVNVLRRPSLQIYEYAQLWRGLLDEALQNIVFVPDVWAFLNSEIMNLFNDDFLTMTAGYWPNATLQNNYIYGNRQLGAIRLRQLRVLPTDCPYIQQKFFNQDPSTQSLCFGEYDSSLDEGKKGESFQRSADLLPIDELSCEEQDCVSSRLVGKKWYNATDRFGKQANHSICIPCIGGDDNTSFVYKSYQELGESSINFGGGYGSYPGGGYVVDIYNQPDGRRILERLQYRHNWFDLKTRALFVDFAFYNPNVDLFLITRVLVEFLPSGIVKASSTYRVLQVTTYDPLDYTTAPLLALEGTLAVFLLWYAIDEAVRIYASVKRFRFKVFIGLKTYFLTGWNAFEFSVLTGLIGVTYMKITNIQTLLEFVKDMSAIDASALQTLGFWLTQESNLTGSMCLVIWMKIFRYITITQRLERLFMAMSKAVPDTMVYLIVFAVWIIAYSVAAVAIFGTSLQEFSTLYDAIITCMRITFGDFDVVAIQGANKILGPIWIWSFMLSAVLVLLNFLVAILCEVYAEVSAENQENKTSSIVETLKRRTLKIIGLKQKVASIENLEAGLDDIDEDNDGIVTKVELQSFLEKEGAYELFDATETSEVMSRFDTNGNGYLDLLEMQALREVLRERKKEYQGEIGKAKAAESKASERIMKRGAGIGDLQSEIHSLNSKVVEITKQVERNTEMEQKMMSLIVNIGSKVDTLVNRDKDFKFLKEGIGQDWLK